MVILRRIYVSLVAIVVSISSFMAFSRFSLTFAANYCVSEKCKAAEAAEAAAKAKSNEASAAASSYQEEVNRLNSEIAVIESEIASLEAEAEDLTKQIAETEEKLNRQQTALAKLIVEMHFETGIDPIFVLAGSTSISDLAEKEAREQTVEEQVTASSKEIKALKTQLEEEKIAIDLMISSANSKRAEIATARARQQELVDKYQNDASSYLADSEAARKEKEAEIEIYRQAYIASLGHNTILVDPGLNSYPYAGSCPGINWRYTGNLSAGAYGGLFCECVSYAGYKAYEYWGVSTGWGDAKYWGSGAARAGYTVDDNPAPHTIGYYTYGAWGHVVWIETVNSDGTIDYSEYNGHATADFSYVKGASAGEFRYIHFD